ncbi:uncharacterized protein PGTG_19747 [Puccinia graminis f. sp. tritici CRL 75-36-700-3]|uniref:Uncharacterized protein n=1 Tax=Puccinia graminis f. sp. tritici (strain CRL 75-36-700-3 / race SCCL) TaxID=418459 RepID=E3LBK5_PUCGT|nr:uncharacterized protein PGTG_19747 [Puccinia graminis f. sp. tritici CRL 75-36-700-3]EFP93930.1 hypothetical protein PGTG_19747 [Puccinia graminis f. sp. tritici CRL 75-36-700-3]
MAAQPTTNNNKTSPPNNNPTLAQANQLNPPAASNPGTTTTAPTTPVPPQFNLTECSKYLFSRNTAEMEALSSREVPPSGTVLNLSIHLLQGNERIHSLILETGTV